MEPVTSPDAIRMAAMAAKSPALASPLEMICWTRLEFCESTLFSSVETLNTVVVCGSWIP